MMRWIPRLIRREIITHLTDGQSIRGMLAGEYRDSLVLSHAAYLGSEGSMRVDGEVVIPRDKVAWIQVLHGTEAS